VLSGAGIPLLALSALGVAGFGVLQRRLLAAVAPGVLLSFFAGAGLVAALAEVPILARTLFGLDDLGSALLLARFLAGVAVGTLGAGFSGVRGRRAIAAGGLLLAGACYWEMAGWDRLEPLRHAGPFQEADLVLFASGLGFGLVVAPVLAAVFDASRGADHGAVASLAVLGRMTGMLAGVAVLAAYGLHRFYGDLRGCAPGGFNLGAMLSPRFQACANAAAQHQYHDIFLIAAGSCGLGAVVATKLGR
jgi:hypothetical protein